MTPSVAPHKPADYINVDLKINYTRKISEMFPERKGERRDIRTLWDNRFRVNFWNEEPTRITRSYFVRVDDDGHLWIVDNESIKVEEPVV